VAAEIPENRVFALSAVRLRLDSGEHPWVEAERAAIAASWAREEIERPWLFNGTVLLHRGLRLEDGLISGVSHRAPYAALLHLVGAWPQADVWHLFGSAIILSCDGAMLLVRMAGKTANPGKVYAAAGSLDESDIRGGLIDVDGSIHREAREETGIDLSAAQAENQLLCWRRGGLVAVFRRFLIAETADVIAGRMRAHAQEAPDQEVADIVVVRRPGEAGDAAPPYMRALIEHHFAFPSFVSGWQANKSG
jgi:8-oxo-dGTP pyrophosphatase MutT (NUDIX family)